MASNKNEAKTLLGCMSSSILEGNATKALEFANLAVNKSISIDDITTNGILSAWQSFSEWYERDPKESLKAWLDCYKATNGILKLLDSKIAPCSDPPFSVLVATVKGEGHVLMKDIIATLLKSKGLKVYSSRKGVLLEDLQEPFSDSKLKFVVLSCIETPTEDKLCALVKGIRQKRPDVKIVAGGPLAAHASADLVLSDPLQIYGSLVELART